MIPQKKSSDCAGEKAGTGICTADSEDGYEPCGKDFGTDQNLPQPVGRTGQGQQNAPAQSGDHPDPYASKKPDQNDLRRHRNNPRRFTGSS